MSYLMEKLSKLRSFDRR